MYNNMVIVGRLTRDVQVFGTQTGGNIATFDVACDVGYGEYKSTYYKKCKLTNKLAGSLNRYIHKGSLIMAAGECQLETWQDKKTGVNRQNDVLYVKDIRFLDSKSAPQETPAPSVAQAAVNNYLNQPQQPAQQQDYATNPNDYVEDAPF